MTDTPPITPRELAESAAETFTAQAAMADGQAKLDAGAQGRVLLNQAFAASQALDASIIIPPPEPEIPPTPEPPLMPAFKTPSDAAKWPIKLFRKGTVGSQTTLGGVAAEWLEFVCGVGDHGLADGRERSQVGFPPGHSGMGLERNTDNWFGFLLWMPHDLNPLIVTKGDKPKIAYNIWVEWMPGSHTFGNNSFGVDRDSGDLVLRANGGGRAGSGSGRTFTLMPAKAVKVATALPRGSVHRFEILIRPGDDVQGAVEVWHDDENVVPHTTCGTMWDEDEQLHPNIGIYRGAPYFKARTHLAFGNFRRADSRAALLV